MEAILPAPRPPAASPLHQPEPRDLGDDAVLLNEARALFARGHRDGVDFPIWTQDWKRFRGRTLARHGQEFAGAEPLSAAELPPASVPRRSTHTTQLQRLGGYIKQQEGA
jgi:hypothetical protein